MIQQHGIERIARNVALLGAAYWAADGAQASGMLTEVIPSSEGLTHCAASHEVR